MKKPVLKNLTKFTGKRDSSAGVLFVNFAKFLRTPFLYNINGGRF